VGEIRGVWVSGERKAEILAVVSTAKVKGVSVRKSCIIMMISRRRVLKWQKRSREGFGLEDFKSGPKKVLHALLPLEREKILEMAKLEKYADMSHRILAVTAWDRGLFFASFTTVYRILHSENMMLSRGIHRKHNGHSLPPARDELTGPNQRWCWDISYLLTYEKYIFLYLYLLLDEYSRKAISWVVSWNQNAQESRLLLEGGLINENILDLPEDRRPCIINDRGSQMKAKPIKRMFEDHHMPQLFSRPRTPNDNPFVESAFSTVKRSPQYPARFRDREEAIDYFTKYVQWYNTEHYHCGIEYVTPDQAHRGLRDSIVAKRKDKLLKQRMLRKEVNQSQINNLPKWDKTEIISLTNRPQLCSVIQT
jgi:putative transposase